MFGNSNFWYKKTKIISKYYITPLSAGHCESGEWVWLKGEAALQMHSFRDAVTQPVIPPNAKKILEYPPSS